MNSKVLNPIKDVLWHTVWVRRFILFVMDLSLSAASFYLAHLLRFDGTIPATYYNLMTKALPLFLICRGLPYLFFGFYNRYWEYSSLDDLFQIGKAVATGTLLFFFINYLLVIYAVFPRSVIIIDMVLVAFFLGATRLFWRLWREHLKSQMSYSENSSIKTLILGAGDTGVAFLKNIKNQFSQYEICGFIDDNPMKLGKVILGVKVLGNRNQLPKIAVKHEVKEIFIACNHTETEFLSQVTEVCNQNNLHYKMVSPVIDLTTNEIHSSKIRNIEIADLLGREPVSLDFHSIRHLLKNRHILVTGAGGSIGSELCRQILDFEPATMIMVDRSENYLHDLSTKLNPSAKRTEMHYQFVSVTNQEKMSALFAKFQPNVVFHAAAHKHVPLMESNPDEAIFNNAYGTKVVADLSAKFGVQKFILVSTDKVVRPTNVMGMTKKAAELYIQHMGSKTQTRFITVRFGNVLGSNGSVVPLFQRQIESGGPVTITHPDMRRFFMLISEAAQLIIQAAAIGNGREIFILEMGDQIKIVDLARQMIRLAGYTPEKDIEIKFTGIRLGEKLYEELVDDGEVTVPTFHKKINILRVSHSLDISFESRYLELCEMKNALNQVEAKDHLKTFLSYYKPITEYQI